MSKKKNHNSPISLKDIIAENVEGKKCFQVLSAQEINHLSNNMKLQSEFSSSGDDN